MVAESADIKGDVDITGTLKIDNVDILDEIESIKTINGQYLTASTIDNTKITDVNANKITGSNLTLSAENLSDIVWRDSNGTQYGLISMDSPQKTLYLYGNNATYIGMTSKPTYVQGNVIFENPIVGVFG